MSTHKRVKIDTPIGPKEFDVRITPPPLAKFKAEIIEVKSKKLASLDRGYRIVLETDESSVMTLGVLDADVVVDVTVEVEK